MIIESILLTVQLQMMKRTFKKCSFQTISIHQCIYFLYD